MKKIYFLLSLLFSINTATFAQCGWIDINNGDGGLETWGITTDATNNVYLSGLAIDTISFGNDSVALPNEAGYFVYKLNSDGIAQWVTQFNLPSVTFQYQFPPVIYQKNGAIYVAGNYYDSLEINTGTLFTSAYPGAWNFFMLKLDLNGNLLWAKNINGNEGYNAVFGIAVDNNSQVYLTGAFSDTVTFGSTTLMANEREAFLLKTDSNGNVLWAQQSTTTSSEPYSRAWGITLDNNDNIIISGGFNNEIAFGSQTFNSNNPDVPSFFPANPYIAKFDSSGTCLWITGGQGAGSFGEDYTVVTDENNNVYTTGGLDSAVTFNSTTLLVQNGTFFYCKYSPSGNLIWAKQTATGIYEGPNAATSLLIDKSSNLWMSGWTDTSTMIGNFFLPNYGVFVAKLDTNGNILNALVSQGMGGGNYYEALDGNGSLYFTSGSGDTASFNGVTAITDTNVSASVLVKYCTSGAGGTYQPMFGYHHTWNVDQLVVVVSPRSSQYDNLQYNTMDAYGDTIISTKLYYKAKIYNDGLDTTSPMADTTFLFREDTTAQQVWIRTSDSSEKLLYDFSLQQGDSVYLTFDFQDTASALAYYDKTGWYFVDSVKTVNIYAGARKALFLSNPHNKFNPSFDSTGIHTRPEIEWIEQIGSTIMPDYLQRDINQLATFYWFIAPWDYFDILLCSYDNNGKMYHNHALDSIQGVYTPNDSCEFTAGINQLSATNNLIKLYPNSTGGEINIVSTKTIDAVTVTNLLGQTVLKSPPAGGDLGVTQFTFELKDEGMYFVTVMAEGGISTSEIIVSK